MQIAQSVDLTGVAARGITTFLNVLVGLFSTGSSVQQVGDQIKKKPTTLVIPNPKSDEKPKLDPRNKCGNANTALCCIKAVPADQSKGVDKDLDAINTLERRQLNQKDSPDCVFCKLPFLFLLVFFPSLPTEVVVHCTSLMDS